MRREEATNHRGEDAKAPPPPPCRHNRRDRWVKFADSQEEKRQRKEKEHAHQRNRSAVGGHEEEQGCDHPPETNTVSVNVLRVKNEVYAK